MTSQPPSIVAACYNSIARQYAERYSNEMANKPMDREMIQRFVESLSDGDRVLDLGCGPGEIAGHLRKLGFRVMGIDLSERVIEEARRLHPDTEFKAGNMFALELPDSSVGGVVAFYAIVHFSLDQVRQVLAEIRRVLRPGGRLLFTYHIGDDAIHVEEFLGSAVPIDFILFQTPAIRDAVAASGLELVSVVEREPYPDAESQTRRAYVFCRNPDRE